MLKTSLLSVNFVFFYIEIRIFCANTDFVDKMIIKTILIFENSRGFVKNKYNM